MPDAELGDIREERHGVVDRGPTEDDADSASDDRAMLLTECGDPEHLVSMD